MTLSLQLNDSASPLSLFQRNQIVDATARLEESFDGLSGCLVIVQHYGSSAAGQTRWGIHLTLTTDAGRLLVRQPPNLTFQAAVDDAFLAAWRHLYERGQALHHESATNS